MEEFLLREVVEVGFVGAEPLLGGIELPSDPVQPSQHEAGKGHVGVAGCVDGPELEASLAGVLHIGRDPDGCRAVALGENGFHRRLVPWDQTSVRVGRGVRQGQQGRGVVQNAGDVVQGYVAELVKPVVVVKDVHTVPGEEVMDVHPVPWLLREELGEEGDDLVPLIRDAVGDHFRQNRTVGHLLDGRKVELDFGLAATYLVVVVFHVQAQLPVDRDDLASDGEEVIIGLGSEISALGRDPV